ncbi:MAG: ABC transporter ATP-binding protein [Pseudomonadota bacterium]|nr:ABC transporter ATP-binding protein [Pseudomonadota bacterium]
MADPSTDGPILAVSELCKQFGALTASDHVSFDLVPGEIHALIGPNGAGKSTLINQVTGSIAHDSGSIRFDGHEIGGLSVADRARHGLARTYQISSLAPEFTALQNVVLAVQAASGRTYRFFRPALSDKALVEPALVHLARVGLEARAGVRAADLSHGEKRQLEIAMALALVPKAFLLDEPMAGMGPEGSKQLTGFLDGLRAEAPILLVEHDMDAVFSLADRISVLVYGRLIATGSVAEIRSNEEVRRAYLGEEAS